MKIREVVKIVEGKVVCCESMIDSEITRGLASDLMSDVLTLDTDLAAVILVKGYMPDEDTAGQSNEEGVPVLVTSLPAFEIAGKLYEILK